MAQYFVCFIIDQQIENDDFCNDTFQQINNMKQFA